LLVLFPCTLPGPSERRLVVPVKRSRRKTSITPFVSPAKRFVAELANVMYRPSFGPLAVVAAGSIALDSRGRDARALDRLGRARRDEDGERRRDPEEDRPGMRTRVRWRNSSGRCRSWGHVAWLPPPEFGAAEVVRRVARKEPALSGNSVREGAPGLKQVTRLGAAGGFVRRALNALGLERSTFRFRSCTRLEAAVRASS
jgi:hypothetical protein